MSSKCAVCYDNVLSGWQCSACKSFLCMDCLTAHLVQRISVNTVPADCPSCMVLGIQPAVISHDAAEFVLCNTQSLAKYREVRARKENPDIRFCPNPKCHREPNADGSADRPDLKCKACELAYCFHHETAHAGRPCRDTHGVDLRTKLWKWINTKKCPKCRSPIQKRSGCHRMTCIKCKHRFCWKCFADLRNPYHSTCNSPNILRVVAVVVAGFAAVPLLCTTAVFLVGSVLLSPILYFVGQSCCYNKIL